MQLQRAVWALLVLSGLCVPAGDVRAWTDTVVEAASAHVEVQPDGTFKVALQVGVHIRGGWLSRFDIEGLGPTGALDPDKPCYLVGTDGRKYTPRVKLLPPGRARLGFPDRHSAPWRGHYRIGLFYTAGPSKALERAGDGRVIMRWQLPAWQRGLEDVDLWVTAPAGTDVHVEQLLPVARQRWDVGSVALHHLKRAQLPRTQAWPIELSVPRDRLFASALPEPQRAHRSVEPRTTDYRGHLLIAALLALSLLKQRLPIDVPGRRRFMLPMGSQRARTALTIAFGGLASIGLESAAVWTYPTMAAVVLAGIGRHDLPAERQASAAPGRLHPIPPGWLALARQRRLTHWFAASSWLDATRPPGACLLAGLWTAVTVLPLPIDLSLLPLLGPYTAMLATALFLTDTRVGAPLSGEARALRLHALQARLAGSPTAHDLRLVASEATLRGRGTDVRLQWLPTRSPVGLTRLDCILTSTRHPGQTRGGFAWVARVERGSPADRQLGRLLPRAHRATDDRNHLTISAQTRSPAADGHQLLTALAEAQRDNPPAARAAA